MVSFFRDKSAVAVFWLIIVCFGLHVYSLVHPPQIVIKPSDGFFYYIIKPFVNADAYIVSLFYVLMIFLLALQLNFILNALRMMPKPSYTPALAFILFSALLPQLNAVTPALFAADFFIWILFSASRLYAAPNAKTAIYNFGLLTGLCAVLYFPSLPLVPIAFIALAIIRPFNFTEWFVLLFGLITPAYFIATYLFLTDQLSLLPVPQQLFGIFYLPVQSKFIIISLLVAAITTAWGIFIVQGSGKNVLIQIRKSWSVFLVSLILLAPVFFFVNGAFPLALFLIMIPASCYAGFAFANSSNILPAIFFWLLVGLSIYNMWIGK